METKRTLAQILALLPDNINKEISPEDVRDAIYSVFDTWGATYLTTPSIQTLTSSPSKLTGFNSQANASGGGILASSSGSVITVNIDGNFLVLFGGSFYGTVSQDITIKAYKNDSAPIPIQKGCRVTTQTATDYLDVTGIAFMQGAGTIQLYGSASSSASLTKYQQFLAAIKIG